MPKNETPEDGVIRGYESIPNDDQLKALSFVKLAHSLANAGKDSALFIALDREHKKRLTRDAAEINRKNVLIGGVLAGCFGLSGVWLGWWLRDQSFVQKPTDSSALSQIYQRELREPSKVAAVPPLHPVASQPPANPAPMQQDSAASQKRP